MKKKQKSRCDRGRCDEGRIVGLRLLPALSPKQRVRFFRQLYGYKDRSQYGKYLYPRQGILDKLGYVPFARGVFIIPTQALPCVKSLLKGKAQFDVRRVLLTPSDRKQLKPK